MSTTTTSSPGATPPATLSVRTAARVAGVAYLAIYALAIFANFAVVQRLVVTNDAVATAANLTASSGLVRAGFVAFLMVFVADLVIAWALLRVFSDIDRELARLAAWARLIYTAFLGVGLVFYLNALRLISGDYRTALGVDQLSEQVGLSMASFTDAWLIGLVVFGGHLVLISVLLARSIAPRAMAWLIGAAGIAYAADTVLRVVLPDYAAIAPVMLAIVAVPSMVGEGWLAGWLLWSRKLHTGAVTRA